jgi:hypothetical protein
VTRQLQRLFTADVFALRVLLAVCSFLFAFGLWFADSSGGAYNSMLRHAPAFIWGCAFFAYGSFAVAMSVRPYRKLVAYVVSITGIYLWLFTLLSFADNPNRPMGSGDMILFALVFIEVWVGAANISGASE